MFVFLVLWRNLPLVNDDGCSLSSEGNLWILIKIHRKTRVSLGTFFVLRLFHLKQFTNKRFYVKVLGWRPSFCYLWQCRKRYVKTNHKILVRILVSVAVFFTQIVSGHSGIGSSSLSVSLLKSLHSPWRIWTENGGEEEEVEEVWPLCVFL